MNAKTVGAVATLTGVSVRTLHHYDDIGLVVPSVRTPAGYRGYTDADVERLRLVLTYRAVGLPLEEIRALLDDADADVVENLQRQHALLTEQANRLQLHDQDRRGRGSPGAVGRHRRLEAVPAADREPHRRRLGAGQG
jgi:MerR family transcriptional regulator, thiopeptide resistance regulator